MKQLLIITLFALPCLAKAQTQPSKKEQTAVQQLVIDTFQSLLSDYDSTKMDTYLTPDFVLLEHGEVWNNDTIQYYITKALQNSDRAIRTNRFEFIKMEKSGDMIWAAYKNWAIWTKDEEIVHRMHWLESVVAVREDEKWKLKMMHSTRIENE
ncbi:nuclear transport factor 2 family protein [Reichenbachiella sp.]|uniref:nuclear transport factor 2 family protein n=1 Tax=Reichenbachiella sp. TaxID=2184521 RepID=UPI003B5CAFC9